MGTSAPVLVEACVDTLESARRATSAGAGRLELCAGLVEGGITPSAGVLAAVLEAVAIPVFVLIRPRGGDFLYDPGELDVMLRDIAAARRAGAHGIVTGGLDREGKVETGTMRRLLDAARPMAVTFHRAFDLAHDPDAALDALRALGVERVLTSGQAPTAEAGIPVLRRLVARADAAVTVMAGGGVTEGNAARIVRETGVREVHLRGSRAEPSPMRWRRVNLHLGTAYQPDEYRRIETDPDRIRGVVAAVSA